VHWKVASDPGERKRLAIAWNERGLDPSREIRSPAASGYGRELIERALPYTLGATTKFELQGDEVHCHIQLPLERAAAAGKDHLLMS
jgi:hypothetical protein